MHYLFIFQNLQYLPTFRQIVDDVVYYVMDIDLVNAILRATTQFVGDARRRIAVLQ